MLDKISLSKSMTVEAGAQGTWMNLTSLYYLGIRHSGVLAEEIKSKLKPI